MRMTNKQGRQDEILQGNASEQKLNAGCVEGSLLQKYQKGIEAAQEFFPIVIVDIAIHIHIPPFFCDRPAPHRPQYYQILPNGKTETLLAPQISNTVDSHMDAIAIPM